MEEVLIYDLRNDDDSLRRLWAEIEVRHGVSWNSRTHSLSGFKMTDDRANEFIEHHRAKDVKFAVIFDYAVTVYLSDSVEGIPWINK